MKPILKVKIAIDAGMTAALLLLMSYGLIGEAAHEWIGMAMFGLFVAHHILNRRWICALRRDMADYLFLRSHFVFYDYEQPVILFLLDYMAIMGLFVWIGHSVTRLIQKNW